ncbi:hypothetical protein L484_009679 [Morus notabilis]|uniref:Uncharacterized protein n=1 Tax=Morus notabilis TaxID=981085 RepID=W9S305_9ROSA|nr:hypothetical protein L484_009679 [Morus notabilis]
MSWEREKDIEVVTSDRDRNPPRRNNLDDLWSPLPTSCSSISSGSNANVATFTTGSGSRVVLVHRQCLDYLHLLQISSRF